jgi:putative two-component system response regulator
LIIDDQKLHALYLQKVLEKEGYRNVGCENDPLHVITRFKDFQPDLIVLDLVMPQMDGFQVMERLNDFRKDSYVPILAISPDADSEVRLRALQSGATDILTHPYEIAEVIFRIRNMIEMRILHLQLQNQNKILELRVQERTKELRENQLDIIRRLAQAAEFRDTDTGVHIIRMSQYCAKLGEALGMNDRDCELLLNASPLHDIGKIGISDSILKKPGKLTPEEYEIMKTHTTIGAKLLSGSTSPLMKLAQTIALTHHEKWDGTGYPNKIKGEEIPFTGQICSVADVFDALTSKRPYKEPWTSEQAIEEMVKGKGTHFNPAMIDRFLAILPEIEKIKKKYSD